MNNSSGVCGINKSMGTEDFSVFGLPGPMFYVLHMTAITCLVLSLGACLVVLSILRPSPSTFWGRTIGERLTVYLAFCDILYSITHLIDHIYMAISKAHAPDQLCTTFGFFAAMFIITQSLIISFTAVSAFILVVLGRRVSLGRYDWRLSLATVVPVIILSPLAGLGWLGPSGGW